MASAAVNAPGTSAYNMNLPMTRPRLTSGMKAMEAMPSASMASMNGASDGSRVTSSMKMPSGSRLSTVHGECPSTARR